MSPRRSTSSSKRFLVAVARASSSASKITSAGTPFSLDTDSTTSSTSLLIVRLASRNPLGSRGSALQDSLAATDRYTAAHRLLHGPAPLIKTGNDVGLVDRVDGQQILMIVDKHDDILVFHAAQQPLEVASPLEGRTQSNLYLLAGMPGELIQREQRPVHARRRHLQGVLDADRVLDIEHPADLTADLLAI